MAISHRSENGAKVYVVIFTIVATMLFVYLTLTDMTSTMGTIAKQLHTVAQRVSLQYDSYLTQQQQQPAANASAVDINKTINGYLQNMQYRTTNQTAELKLNISRTMLTNLGFPITNFSVDAHNFVFVTAGGGRHFHIAMDAIALIQTLFPNNTVYFYDLGNLGAAHVEKMHQLCNVNYRKFNYSRYPTHVQNLHTYAFKPILIHELLHDHSNVFWVDSSIRFKTGNLTATVNQTIKEGRGLMTFDNCGHSNFAATHALMYRYLPINKDFAAKTWMRGASAIFILSNKGLYDNVLRWWFLCALVHNCMAPTRDLYCRFKGRDVYANCHRYDQSAINIVLANYFQDDSQYFSRFDVLSNNRGNQHQYKLYVCKNETRLNTNLTRIMSKDYFV